MTEMNHTPGPWTTGTDDPTGVWAGGHYIAETFTDGEANARLIAAAPDMLAALKALGLGRWKATDSTKMEWRVEVNCYAREKAMAAIAKAEGR